MTRPILAGLFALTALLPAIAAHADDIADKAALCAACHGEAGVPADKSIPVIWGQNEAYLNLELRDYKLGTRRNATMEQVVLDLEKADMQALAAYFAAKPWPGLDQPAASGDVARHAEAVATTIGCNGCHLAEWQGNDTTPRLGGQGRQYLHDTMMQIRDGTRANNPAMTALLKTSSDSDIDALAQFLAGR